MVTYLMDCKVHIQNTTHNPITKNVQTKGPITTKFIIILWKGCHKKILATVDCVADRESSYILGTEQVLLLVTLTETTWKT